MTHTYKVGAGHVTAGGSICIEALTLSGTAGSWTSQYNVESMLNIVMLNMVGEASFLLTGLRCLCVEDRTITHVLSAYIHQLW